MEDTWQMLMKELAVFGFKLNSFSKCTFENNGRPQLTTIAERISRLRKSIRENGNLLEELLTDVSLLLRQPSTESESPVDDRLGRLFTESLKGLLQFSEYFVKDQRLLKRVDEDELFSVLRSAVDRDITAFPKRVVSSLPDHWIAVEWVWRKVSRLSYVINLFKLVLRGKAFVSQKPIKEARGVSGPWANHDLPMRERVFEWREIEEDMQGKQQDIKNQRRYKMGLENYNNDGRVGEGFFWREIRNEPYLWTDREEESPYSGSSMRP